MQAVGHNVPRKDSDAKVRGQALYLDDIDFPGVIYARTVRSTIPRGRVTRLNLRHRPPELVVADAADIPGPNVVKLIEDDQPFLAEGRIEHYAEPLLLLAHPDRERLQAVDVDVQYRAETPLLDPHASTECFKEIRIDKGEVEHGLAAAERIVEGEYRTRHQEQLYIEPQGVVAVPENGGVTIYGSIQCPYYVHKAVKAMLALPDEAVRVVVTETGGGFGGKEEYPSIIAGHAALLALKAGRPVKMVYDRVEDMEATTKRHPSVVRHRTGVASDGTITAIDVDVLMDGGAYVTLSPVVLSRGVLHATGPYRADHVRVRGRVVKTNTPPNGAFRGFGAPQTQFASEVQMERVAEVLELDPVDCRRRNAWVPGDTTATGQELGADCTAVQVLDEAVARSDFATKRRRKEHGIGLALFFHGSGFTGNGELQLASRASLALTADGVRVLVASTEIGQGTRTMHAQIVADALRIPYDAVHTAQPDTHRVPDSGPTVASRTCMVVGGILERCARTMRQKIGAMTPAEYFGKHGELIVTEAFQNPAATAWDEVHYVGDAYATYAWACDVAEVELDPDTYEVRPLKITAVQDIGKAIHPQSVAGQIEGGTAQGVGMALGEVVVMQEGRMANAQLTNYTIPTTHDTPAFDVVIMETPFEHGPHGAKGVGELPVDGAPPALVNALRHLGLDVREVPATPERLMEAACNCA